MTWTKSTGWLGGDPRWRSGRNTNPINQTCMQEAGILDAYIDKCQQNVNLEEVHMYVRHMVIKIPGSTPPFTLMISRVISLSLSTIRIEFDSCVDVKCKHHRNHSLKDKDLLDYSFIFFIIT